MNAPTSVALAPEQAPSTASLSSLLDTTTSSPAPLVPISAPVSSSEAAALVDARPLSPPAKRKIRRNGRVACLPKQARDVVNRMLSNGLAYKNIVGAIGEIGYTLTERNVSNWATGGYLEWRLEQEAVLQNRLDQDHLVDFLRRDGAPELSEVGLQAASSHLSQLLLRKLSQDADPEANLNNYSHIIDLLCRLRREVSASQKERDDERRRLGPEFEPARVKEEEEVDAIECERFYSDPPSGSTLPKPAEPPFLLPIPTASFNAEENALERRRAEIQQVKERTERIARIYQSLGGVRPSPGAATATTRKTLLRPRTAAPRPFRDSGP